MVTVYYSFRPATTTLCVGLLLSTFLFGCLADHNPAPRACCLLSATEGDSPTQTWTYRADGQFASANGITYSYNTEGYVAQTVDKPGSSTTVYEYTSGRLTKASGLRTNGVRSLSTTATYTYEAGGDLSRLVVTSRDRSETLTETYHFRNGKQIDYINSQAYPIGGRPYTFDNGLVWQAIAYNSKTGGKYVDQTYAYDAQERLIRVTYAS
jgi:hypothetical protein